MQKITFSTWLFWLFYFLPKVILHGVKSPQQFQALHALYQEPKLQQCVGSSHLNRSSAGKRDSSSSSGVGSSSYDRTGKRSTPAADLSSEQEELEEEGVHRFSEAQQPPIRNIEGYAHTPHGQKHAVELLSRVPHDLRASLLALLSSQHSPGRGNNGDVGNDSGITSSSKTSGHSDVLSGAGNEAQSQLPVLGASPWENWPVFEPNDCNAVSEKVETAWDRHVAKLGQPGAYSQTHLSEDSHLAL